MKTDRYMRRWLGIAIVSSMFAGQAVLADGGGDPVKGRRMFAQCMSCHTIAAGAENRVGPNLYGIVGRKAGTVEGFDYSPAMKQSDVVWNEDALDQYLKQPAKFMPGTKMVFMGVAQDQARADIIAFMKEASPSK